MDTTDDFVFLSVEHDDQESGSLYVSDDQDTNFVLSIERVKVRFRLLVAQTDSSAARYLW